MTEKAAQFYDHPPNYAGIIRKIYDIKGEGLGRVKAYTIGRSILGRGLFALTLGQIRGSTLFVGAYGGRKWFHHFIDAAFF
jgi:g-D-glutamyl-meso-diaminopimelate peptidase